MKRLTATICLTIAVLLGSAGVSWSADFQKGFAAYQSGNYATTLREWEPLAEQGDAESQLYLGRMYDVGRGVIQDNAYAYMWFNIALLSGKKKDAVTYQTWMRIVAGRMAPSQIETAQKLARECVRKKYKGC